jgi:hypothetical protein
MLMYQMQHGSNPNNKNGNKLYLILGLIALAAAGVTFARLFFVAFGFLFVSFVLLSFWIWNKWGK